MTNTIKTLFWTLALICLSQIAFAQPGIDVPQEPGKCYAKCIVANQYDNVTEQILVKDAYSKLDVVVPEYETVTEQVMVKAASTRIVPVPAVYETVTEQIMVKAASKRIIAVEGSYETVTDDNLYMGSSQGISEGKGSITDPNNPNGLSGSMNPSNADSPYNPNNPMNMLDPANTNPNDPNSPLNPNNPNSPFHPNNIQGANGNPNATGGRNVLGIGTMNPDAIQQTNVGTIVPYIVKEATTKVERVPMQFETITEQVEVSPATSKWVKRQGDKNCLSEDPNDCLVWCMVEIPAKIQTVSRKVPKGCPGGYVQGGGGSYGGTKDECVRVVQVPAVYGSRTIIKQAPSYREEVIPAQYKTITKEVLVSEATFRTEYIEPQYKTVTRQIRKGLKSMNYVDPTGVAILPAGNRNGSAGADTAGGSGYPDAINPGSTTYDANGSVVSGSGFPSTNPFDNLGVSGDAGSGVNGAGGAGNAGGNLAEPNVSNLDNFYTAGCPDGYTFDPKDGTCKKLINVPAQYNTISKRVLTQTGGLTEWKEVLCGNKVNSYTVRQIQDELRNRGYDPGPSDNAMGAATKAALVKFQQDNGLPVGQLDLQTLQALGINY